jgi:hypothetical protein
MLWTIFGVLYAWAILASLWTGFSAWRFLSKHRTISDERALKDFKSLARWNMYFALVQLGVLVSGSIVGILLIVKYGLIKGLVSVLVANGIVLGLGKVFKSLEDRARSLPAATGELAAEHRRVSETWIRKPLPDF